MRSLFLIQLFACSAEPTPLSDPQRFWNEAPVEIIRDNHGVPHLYAESDIDLFHAAGYQLGVDRLYQAEMLRRFSQGRLSEVIGEEGIERDQQVRIFDVPRWGQADMEWMEEHDPERVDLLNAWVSGINRRVDEVLNETAPLPFGYGPEGHNFLPTHWENVDPYTILKGANFALDKTLEFEIAITLLETLYPETMAAVDVFRPGIPTFAMPESERPAPDLLPQPTYKAGPAITDLSPELLQALTSFRRPSGSNSWAIAGEHTTTGRAAIAGDPHLGFDFFGSPMPMHLNSADGGGSYDVAGFAFPGTPGIALGQTNSVAWTATSAFVDVMDVFDVTRTADGVMIGEDEHPIIEREETIIVRTPGSPVGEGVEFTEVYEDIPGVGVLLPQSFLPLPLGDYVVTWTGFTGRRAAWFMELNQASDLDSFEDSVRRMKEMNYNLVAISGNGLSYKVGCEAPDRGQVGGANTPWRVMDGSNPEVWWTDERLDDRALPASRGANRGWVATANNDPWGFTEDGRLDNDPFYYGALFAPGYRASRIEERLQTQIEHQKVSLSDMQDLQMDTHSMLADHLIPVLQNAVELEDENIDPELQEDPNLLALVELLSQWNRKMEPDSTAATAFHALLHTLGRQVLEDDIGLAYDFAVELQTIFILKIADLAIRQEHPSGHVLQAGVETEILTAAANTAEWLVQTYGAVDALAWSDIKVTRFDSALGFGIPLFDRPTAGGEDTVNVAQNIQTDFTEDTWFSSYVSVERVTAEIAEDGTPEMWTQYPFAANADPFSTHNDTANDGYIEGEYRRFWFRRSEVEANEAEHTQLD